MSQYVFYFLSFLAVLSALMVVISKNPVHSVLYFIMMLNLNADVEPHKSTMQKLAATIAGGLLMIILVAALREANPPLQAAASADYGLIKNLGNTLYKDFMLPFEVSAILFLAA